MPFVSIAGIDKERLSFFGIELIAEVGSFQFYKDFEGRISVADKTRPYVWVDDINDAIQLGSDSIIMRG